MSDPTKESFSAPINVSILIVEAVVKYGPIVAEALARMIFKPEPTLEEWLALFKAMRDGQGLGKTYEEWIENGK